VSICIHFGYRRSPASHTNKKKDCLSRYVGGTCSEVTTCINACAKLPTSRTAMLRAMVVSTGAVCDLANSTIEIPPELHLFLVIQLDNAVSVGS
jgi:hypothetical protein